MSIKYAQTVLILCYLVNLTPLQWRHNGRRGVPNYQQLDGLFNYLFELTLEKKQSGRYRLFMRGIHWWPVDSPHKGPVTQKAFPVRDVIMTLYLGFLPASFKVTSVGYCLVTPKLVKEPWNLHYFYNMMHRGFWHCNDTKALQSLGLNLVPYKNYCECYNDSLLF